MKEKAACSYADSSHWRSKKINDNVEEGRIAETMSNEMASRGRVKGLAQRVLLRHRLGTD